MEMINRETLQKMHQEDTEKLTEVEKNAEEIKAKETQKIRDWYDNIQKKIKQLQEEKRKCLQVPTTKEELLRFAKEEYRRHQKHIAIKEILKPHFELCQQHPTVSPFDPLHIGLLFSPDKDWRLSYFIFTDEDIEEAIALLPDIGMPIKEKEEKIKELDKEISQLSNLLKKELKEINKTVPQVQVGVNDEIEGE